MLFSNVVGSIAVFFRRSVKDLISENTRQWFDTMLNYLKQENRCYYLATTLVSLGVAYFIKKLFLAVKSKEESLKHTDTRETSKCGQTRNISNPNEKSDLDIREPDHTKVVSKNNASHNEKLDSSAPSTKQCDLVSDKPTLSSEISVFDQMITFSQLATSTLEISPLENITAPNFKEALVSEHYISQSNRAFNPQLESVSSDDVGYELEILNSKAVSTSVLKILTSEKESISQFEISTLEKASVPDLKISDSEIAQSVNLLTGETIELETPSDAVEMETLLEAAGRLETLLEAAERLETLLEAAERLETPLEAAERLETPLEAAERLETPLEAAERLETPLEAAERLETPLETAERLETPSETAHTQSEILNSQSSAFFHEMQLSKAQMPKNRTSESKLVLSNVVENRILEITLQYTRELKQDNTKPTAEKSILSNELLNKTKSFSSSTNSNTDEFPLDIIPLEMIYKMLPHSCNSIA